MKGTSYLRLDYVFAKFDEKIQSNLFVHFSPCLSRIYMMCVLVSTIQETKGTQQVCETGETMTRFYKFCTCTVL